MKNNLFFCESCNMLTKDDTCTKCGESTRRPQEGDMCFVCELSGIDVNMFADALDNGGIRFVNVPMFSGVSRYNTPSSYKFYVRYENYDEAVETFNVIWGGREVSENEQQDYNSVIDRIVRVTIDRPLDSVHPNHPDIKYELNYGFINGVTGGDGEAQDAYIIGYDKPLDMGSIVDGYVIAVIHRKNDVETKWVVLPYLPCKKEIYTKEEITQAVRFQEKYFDIEIIM